MMRCIPFKTQKETFIIPIDEILYITQNKRCLVIKTTQREFVEYEKIENVLEYLDDSFFQCLKYTVLNMNQVRGFVDRKVIFANGDTFELGRDCFLRTRNSFIAYIKEMKEKK